MHSLLASPGVISDSWMIQGICKEAAARTTGTLTKTPLGEDYIRLVIFQVISRFYKSLHDTERIGEVLRIQVSAEFARRNACVRNVEISNQHFSQCLHKIPHRQFHSRPPATPVIKQYLGVTCPAVPPPVNTSFFHNKILLVGEITVRSFLPGHEPAGQDRR